MNPNPEGDGAPQETTFKKPLPPRSRGDVSAGRSSGGLGTTSGKRKPPQGHPPRATAVAQPSKTQQNPQRPNKRKFLISRSMGTLRAFPQGGKRKRIDTATIPLQVRDVVDPPRTVQSDVVGFGDQTCLKDHAKSDPGNKEKYAEGERMDLGIYTERSDSDMHLQPSHLSTETPPSSASINEALSSTNTTTTRSQQAGDFPSQPQRQPQQPRQQSGRTPVVRHEAVSDLFQNLLNTFSSRSSQQLQEVGNEGGGLARPTPMAGKSSSPSGVGRGLPVHTIGGGRIDARKEGTDEESDTKYSTSRGGDSSYSISTPLIKNSNQKRKKTPVRGPELRNDSVQHQYLSSWKLRPTQPASPLDGIANIFGADKKKSSSEQASRFGEAGTLSTQDVGASNNVPVPKTYSHETASNLFIFAELTGTRKRDVVLNFSKGILTIIANRDESDGAGSDEGAMVTTSGDDVATNSGQAKFRVSLKLPAGVDSSKISKIKTTFSNGLLEVCIPKSEDEDNADEEESPSEGEEEDDASTSSFDAPREEATQELLMPRKPTIQNALSSQSMRAPVLPPHPTTTTQSFIPRESYSHTPLPPIYGKAPQQQHQLLPPSMPQLPPHPQPTHPPPQSMFSYSPFSRAPPPPPQHLPYTRSSEEDWIPPPQYQPPISYPQQQDDWEQRRFSSMPDLRHLSPLSTASQMGEPNPKGRMSYITEPPRSFSDFDIRSGLEISREERVDDVGEERPNSRLHVRPVAFPPYGRGGPPFPPYKP